MSLLNKLLNDCVRSGLPIKLTAAEVQQFYEEHYAELSATKEKLEAAEKRIRESQGQEPVHDMVLYPIGTKFYTMPPIPPELAELQRENAELRKQLEAK